MDLIKFYTRVLKMGNMEVDDKGVVRLIQEHNPAVMIGDKMLVLPTQEQLKSLKDSKEAFHPLSEDTIAGLSNVSRKLLKQINFSLNLTFTQLMTYLQSLATTSSGKMNHTTEQLEILQGIRAQPKKDFDIMKVLGDRFVKNPTGAFVEITLSRTGKALHRGQRVSRIAFVSFPFYTELKKDLEKSRKDSELGLAVDNVQFLIELYETIIPNLDLPEEYNSGAGVVYAPFFTVMMKSAGMLMQTMMRIKTAFPDFVEITDQTETDYSWLSVLDNQEELRKIAATYPNLELVKNPVEKDGVVPADAETVQRTQPNSLAPQPRNQQLHQPVATPVVPATPRLTPQQQHNPNRRQDSTEPKKEGQTYEEWAAGRMGMSQMGMIGAQKENMRRHNEGYRNYWLQHTQTYNAPPPNMPHPDAIPPGQMAPHYPGMVPMPGVNMPMMQQPAMMMTPGMMPQQGMMPPGMMPQTMMYPQPVAPGTQMMYPQQGMMAPGMMPQQGMQMYPYNPMMGGGYNPMTSSGGYRR